MSSTSEVALNGMLWADGVRSIPSIFRGGLALFKAWRASGDLIKLGLEGAAEAANASEVKALLTKAAGTVGNQGVRASSKALAQQAAKEWVGPGATTIVDRNTGAAAGWISADATKVARFTSVTKAQPYINLVNNTTHGNLHVYF